MFGGTHLVNRAGLARTFQNIRLFKEMSVVENLLVAQHMWVNRNLLAGVLNTKAIARRKAMRWTMRFYWLEVVELVDCANRLAGEIVLRPAAAAGDRPGHVHHARRSSALTNRPRASTRWKPKP
jgi:hypothetical protein